MSLVGNVDNLENTVNSTPIEKPFFHDHSKVDRLLGKTLVTRDFFVVFISSCSTKTDG